VPVESVLTGHVDLSAHLNRNPLTSGIAGPVRCGSTVQGILVFASTSVTQMYFMRNSFYGVDVYIVPFK